MDIHLREAKRKDWDFILDLRNSDFQYFYHQKAPLKKDHHYQYMEEQSKNENFHHWIIMSNGDEVGYVRILNEDVGIMIRKEFQGKGLASKALLVLEKEASKIGLKKLVALVDPQNFGSEKIFKKNGYKLTQYRLEKDLETGL